MVLVLNVLYKFINLTHKTYHSPIIEILIKFKAWFSFYISLVIYIGLSKTVLAWT